MLSSEWDYICSSNLFENLSMEWEEGGDCVVKIM